MRFANLKTMNLSNTVGHVSDTFCMFVMKSYTSYTSTIMNMYLFYMYMYVYVNYTYNIPSRYLWSASSMAHTPKNLRRYWYRHGKEDMLSTMCGLHYAASNIQIKYVVQKKWMVMKIPTKVDYHDQNHDEKTSIWERVTGNLMALNTRTTHTQKTGL